MPTRQQIEHAIHTHFDTWNKQDKSCWMANFAVDAVLEDPVGGPVKTGREGWKKAGIIRSRKGTSGPSSPC